MGETATILIAVSDGVLADSLRFSLELEGFEVRLCDEFSVPCAMTAQAGQGCFVLDQSAFARLLDDDHSPAECRMPVVLMVEHRTESVVARARAAGVARLVETPLFGSTLLDAIKGALNERELDRPAPF